MIFVSPRPATAITTSISGSDGITRMPSVIRISNMSTRPPKYPAVIPTAHPNSTMITAAAKPTNSEMRAP